MEQTSRKKKKKQPAQQSTVQVSLTVNNVKPLTDNQSDFFRSFERFNVLSLHGCPGTGKTFIAVYKALKALESPNSPYKSIKIIRSNVSVRDVGFLPGSAADKMAVYEAPYMTIVNDLFGRGDAYGILKQKKIIEFFPTSYMRGVTFNDCIVIIDECQNMSYGELNTIITRFGNNCKMVMCGDTKQDDLTSERYKEQSGYGEIQSILQRVATCKMIEFSTEDIVRSGFVKEYILAQINAAEPKKPVFLREITDNLLLLE